MLRIEDRVEIGNKVKDLINVLQSELETNSDDYVGHYWNEIAEEIKRRDLLSANWFEASTNVEEMTDQEGEAFGITLCPFKAFKDVNYRAVPYDYLANIVDLNKRLARYVRWRYKKRL